MGTELERLRRRGGKSERYVSRLRRGQGQKEGDSDVIGGVDPGTR